VTCPAPMATMMDLAADQPALILHAIMTERRSIRRLQPGPFSLETRDRLLEAVRLTPAAYNLPPWRVVLVQERRAALWAEIEHGFREHLDGDRLDRYLERLEGFASGVAVAMIFEDRAIERELREERGAESEVANSFVHQALGMAQLALWLAIAAEGLVTSLQHWDHLVGPRLAHFAGLPAERFRLVSIMPIGYAAEAARLIARAAEISSVDPDPAPPDGR
jgi:predicted oxidoreductase (fatty acid repression mutant protein)